MKGTLWIGTNYGLNSFNRNEVTSYTHDANNASSLPGDVINFIMEDSHHNLWVSTNNGLAMYNPIDKRFITIIPRRVIQSYLLLDDGILFSAAGYFFKYYYQDQHLQRIAILHASRPSYEAFSKMHRIDRNRVLLVGANNVYVLTLNDWRLHYWFSSKNRIMASFLDSQRRLYISYNEDGLRCMDLKGRELFHITKNNSSLTNNIILDIANQNGTLWLGTDGGGICILNPRYPKQITSLVHAAGDPNSLPNNAIKTLYCDYNNNIWAGTVRCGVFGVFKMSIRTYKDTPLLDQRGLSEKAVISMFEDRNNMLWIGTDGGGINKYDPRTDRFTHYPNTYGNQVSSLTGYSDYELLVSVYGKGLQIFNKNTGRYTPFMLLNQQINYQECFNDYVPFADLLANSKICIMSRHVYVYDLKKKTFSLVTTKSKTDELMAVRMAYANDKFMILFGLNEIFKVDLKSYIATSILSFNAQDKLNTVCYDGYKTLWLGTNTGLYYYNLQSRRIHRIVTNMLSNVTTLFFDHSKRLWIGAKNRLFTYNILQNTFIEWGESDGFSSNELLFSPIISRFAHNIYIGGTSGLVKIDGNVSLKEKIEPHIGLSDLLVDGLSYYNKVDLDKSEISLPWNYKSLILKVVLNDPDLFRKVLFRYSIKELDNKLVETYSPSIDFTNLVSGKYTIMMSCNMKNGGWTKPVRILTIVITPPWYKRPIAIFFLIMLMAAAFFIIAQWRYRLKENRLNQMMKEREHKIAEDKVKFLINVSHEFRTSLTLIHTPLKRLIESFTDVLNQKDEYRYKVLTSIYEQTKKMKSTVDVILDVNRMHDVEERLQKKFQSVEKWIKSVVPDFSIELSNKHISVVYHFNEEVDHLYFDENKCKIVLTNFLANAIKFSPDNTQLTIIVSKRDDFARITVADQGIGLDNVDTNQLFTRFYQGKHDKGGSGIGLAYSKSIIDMHKGNIGAYNNPEGKGSCFYFELPIHVEDNEIIKEPQDNYSQYLPDIVDDSSFSTKNYSIIIVEDNTELRNMLKREFEDSFKKIYTANDGEEGYQKIKDLLPDIIVSDVMMPRMNGYELCRKVKKTLEISHIPIVLLTARADLQSTSIGYKLGADVYLTKPFEIDTLINIIRNQLKTREKIRMVVQKGHTSDLLIDKLTTNNLDEKFLKDLNKQICDNLDNPNLNVDFLIKNMGISRTPLYSKVKALIGIGINDYINNFKIKKAEELLSSTDMTITEISDACGFLYQRYFSSAFKSVTGVTPSQYRKDKGRPSIP